MLALRDPDDRAHGYKILHIGLIDDQTAHLERFLCVSERAAVAPIPSLTSTEASDSGVLLGPGPAARLVDHVRQCYAAARKIETVSAVGALPVLPRKVWHQGRPSDAAVGRTAANAAPNGTP